MPCAQKCCASDSCSVCLGVGIKIALFFVFIKSIMVLYPERQIITLAAHIARFKSCEERKERYSIISFIKYCSCYSLLQPIINALCLLSLALACAMTFCSKSVRCGSGPESIAIQSYSFLSSILFIRERIPI
mgnify:CR=1 FL=1